MTLALKNDADRWVRDRRNQQSKDGARKEAAELFKQDELADVHKCNVGSHPMRGSRLKMVYIAGGLWPLPWRVHYHGEWMFFAKTESDAYKFADLNGWFLDMDVKKS